MATKAKKPVTDEEILAIVERESDNAVSFVTSEIAQERKDAMKRYLGEDYGDEEAGRSQVISRDVFEVIEWAMPSVLKVFAGSENVVEYVPVEKDDEEFAEQATDYANHVFYKDNNGFLLLYTWFKDSFLAKQGVLKSWWHEVETVTFESHEDLTNDEYFAHLADNDTKITAHTTYDEGGVELEEDEEDINYDISMGPVPVLTHDIDITITRTEGRIKTVNVPPEEFFMTYDVADPDDAPFLEHQTETTLSALIEEGYDETLVMSIPSADDATDDSGEKSARHGRTQAADNEHVDPMMREVTIHESYPFIDINNTGVVQRMKVIWVGGILLDKEPFPDQPFSVVQPIPIPHRAYGLSFADTTSDLQRVKTVLIRQTLDNLYLSNNPEREVDVNLITNMDDFLMTRPGGIKRVDKIGASREISHPFVAQHSFAMLDGIDNMIANRTGIKDAVTGVDANVLNNETATASNNNLASANQRIETICRIFAETGVKHLFKLYLKLMTKHQDKARTIRLRKKWVEMDPQKWNANMDVTVDVGLGHGNKDQQVNHLMSILGWQKDMLASGGISTEDGTVMVKPKHIHNTFEKLVKAVGFKNIDTFMDDPGDGKIRPPQNTDPNAALVEGQIKIEEVKASAKAEENNLKHQREMEKMRMEHDEEMARLNIEHEKIVVKYEDIGARMQETAATLEVNREMAADKLNAQASKLTAPKVPVRRGPNGQPTGYAQ